MRTIYLHIGMPKTGTSAIQYFLSANQALLEEKGLIYRQMPWHYPGHTDRRNAHFLTGSIRDQNGAPDLPARLAREDEAFDIISQYFSEKPAKSDKKIIDIGTGAGFPGMPLAILLPEIHFILADSLDKRISFINEFIKLI